MVNDIRYKEFASWIKLLNSGVLFGQGNFSIEFEQDLIKFNFFGKVYVYMTKSLDFRGRINLIRDTLTDIYFHYVRDGKPVDIEVTCLLLGVGRDGARKYEKRIVERLGLHKNLLD